MRNAIRWILRSASSLLITLAILSPLVPVWGAESSGVVRGLVLDASTNLPTACSVRITDASGNVVVENESYLAGFRSNGRFEKTLPAGRTTIRVTRGFETRAYEKSFNLAPGRTANLKRTLSRFVDLRKRGWYAGDSHAHMVHGERTIHTSFEDAALAVHAEDLLYFSLSHAWLLDDPTPEKLDGILSKLSTPDCTITWNVESPKNYYKGNAGACLGHGWFIGARGRTPNGKNLIDLLQETSAWDYESDKPTYANFEIQRLIHEQGGTCYYTHPARWWWGAWGGRGIYPRVERMKISNMAVELPLDTLIGPTYEGLDVMMTTGEAGANKKSFQLWCLLLNHGYRIAATASSDSCFDRRNGGRPGAVRTYTYLDEPFSLSAVSKATARGRTFITSGPLLLVSVEGKPPGTAFPADGSPKELSIEAWASGTDPGGLTRIEIFRNGKPLEPIKLDQPKSYKTRIPIDETENAWWCQ